MKLLIPIFLNCILVLAVYLADKYTPLKKLPYMTKQIIIGLLFGGGSAFASSCGVELLGTVVNVRDALPLSAGLIFSAPAGIISGVIGGLYRFFSVYWGGGEYTQIACTIATIFAGVMAAGFRKLMFDDKKPTWGYGICITVVCEVIHMLLIFLTNIKDSSHAFEFVKGATIPMILGNALAVGLSIVIVSLLSHERLTKRKCRVQIAQTFQRWLLLCIVIAFLLTSVFTFILQNDMLRIETQEVFTTAISDVQADVRGKSDDYLLDIVQQAVYRYEKDPNISLKELSLELNVIEINIVNNDGLIINSTDETLINNFNMNSTEQSKEFSVLTDGVKSLVQEYGPVGSDNRTMRKFAGMALKNGGYIQIGYSAEQFHKMLDSFVFDVTKNRHVGSGGFVAVCDEQLNLVTQTQRNGMHISTIGIEPNAQMLNGESANALCNATIVNADNGFSEDYIYAFTFVEGYCIIAAMPEDEAMFMRDASIYTSVFMQVLIFATLFVFIYILIKKVIINNLKKINQTLAQITNGNLNVTVDVRSNEEFASLSDDINTTVATLKSYISEAEARIDKELEYAKQIQLSALPTNFTINENYGIFAQMIAAKEVGGDFYDFYKLSDSKIAFLVADVSGKGIPAAMFMMTAKTVIKDLAESNLPVNEIFIKANQKLCENNESGMFVTAWMGILDITSGRLQYANAGHNPPLLMRCGGEFEYLRSRPGFVLAGFDDTPYRLNETELKEGDRIFLYTDGVTEATNISQKFYGENRLCDFVNRNKNTPAKDLLLNLKKDIDNFSGEAEQFDDITMLMLDYKPQNSHAITATNTFSANVDALDSVISFTQEKLIEFNCPNKVSNSICLCVEEIFVNIASYAYGDSHGDVEYTISFDEPTRTAMFKMTDSGTKFNPLEKSDPDITLSAEEREIGGLGIFIVKQSMDTVSYSYENGKNIFTMTKKI